eukprot:6176107-Pleurochrysis_carterae.AAC.1
MSHVNGQQVSVFRSAAKAKQSCAVLLKSNSDEWFGEDVRRVVLALLTYLGFTAPSATNSRILNSRRWMCFDLAWLTGSWASRGQETKVQGTQQIFKPYFYAHSDVKAYVQHAAAAQEAGANGLHSIKDLSIFRFASEECRDRDPASPKGESVAVSRRRYRQSIKQDVPCCGVDPQAPDTCCCPTELYSPMTLPVPSQRCLQAALRRAGARALGNFAWYVSG